MSNRLSKETSPYLLQHQNNPVDWYPWGEEALSRARKENKPILLSVGYSACHWCHVMEHESFENAEIAALMNENFVCIKVDREERPDLDQIYQNVAQAITHGGGWPLTVFLTPDLKPFFGGTYYPPEDRWGRPGFPRVLKSLSDAFRNDAASVSENAEKLTDFIRSLEQGAAREGGTAPTRQALDAIGESLASEVDWNHGGLGGAPKFPNPMMLDFLWRYGLATQKDTLIEGALLTFSKMASGGIYDQLGGGFHRYSVDETWSVPHFEKMLYDNGLLLRSYAQILLSSPRDAAGAPRLGALTDENRELFLRVLVQTTTYLFREMQTPQGGFFAAQDADSEGEEGKYFVWDPNDLTSVLSLDEALAFKLRYGVSEPGNFEHGKTVLHLAQPLGAVAEKMGKSVDEVRKLLGSAECHLLGVRDKRIAPGTDDKVLASWNGLMISGLAWSAEALRAEGKNKEAEAAWTAAVKAFGFLSEALARPEGRLYSTWKNGKAKLNAYLDDYAFLAMAAMDLARFESDSLRIDGYLRQAEQWLEVVLKYFKDERGGGYYFTSDDHEALIQRPKTLYDQAIPSGTGVALNAMLALGEIDREGRGSRWNPEARKQIELLFPSIAKRPHGYGELINAALLSVMGPIVVSGTGASRTVKHPHIFQKPADPATSGKILVCHRQSCGLPKASAAEAQTEIQEKLTQEGN